MAHLNKFLKAFLMTVAFLGGVIFSFADPLPGPVPMIPDKVDN